MIKMHFGQIGNSVRDQKIINWIVDLRYEYNDHKIITYNAEDDSLTFKREEDAIAFKLKFGM